MHDDDSHDSKYSPIADSLWPASPQLGSQFEYRSCSSRLFVLAGL